jgi:hypothetical protein
MVNIGTFVIRMEKITKIILLGQQQIPLSPINRLLKTHFSQVAQKGPETRRPKPGTRPEGMGLSITPDAKKS